MKRSRWTIRLQLLVTVNVTLAILVAAFGVIDHRRELADRLNGKQVAMDKEAKTLLPAVLQLRGDDPEAIQKHLDAVCGRMHEAQSPGHHIAVDVGGSIFQATAHGRSSPEIFRVMSAPDPASGTGVRFGNRELVIGRHSTADVTAYVAEDVSTLRRAVRGHVLWRLGGVAALGVIAAVLASVVLVRGVARPINRLVATVHEIAEGNFSVRTGPYASTELADLSNAINTMSASLERAEHHRRQEMDKARRIQEHLLPNSIDVPGLSLTALYRPATDVAGDYYDVLKLNDGGWLLCIADVCGHGVPAAMTATILKACLLHAVEGESAPQKLLSAINRQFSGLSLPGMFASMLLMKWDPQDSSLEYASAGHEPAWLISIDGAEQRLSATGLPLGVDEAANWTAETVEVSPGDRLLLMTDGASETFSPHGELFGRERVRRLLEEYSDCPSEELAARVDKALADHREGRPPADDLTIMAVIFDGHPVTEDRHDGLTANASRHEPSSMKVPLS